MGVAASSKRRESFVEKVPDTFSLTVDQFTLSVNTNAYVDTDISAGVTYRYRVKAVVADGDSDFTDWMTPS